MKTRIYLIGEVGVVGFSTTEYLENYPLSASRWAEENDGAFFNRRGRNLDNGVLNLDAKELIINFENRRKK